jgi:hypothetical protein
MPLNRPHILFLAFAALLASFARGDDSAAPLPPGVKAVWDLKSAWRQTTPTRERLCLNGLWRWQPAAAGAATVPSGEWGYFKVPGAWPGITDYQQKDCQTVFAHPAWRAQKLGAITSAWYQREITAPKEWAGQRIALRLETLNSLAVVYLDGAKVGEIRFPGGELDVSSACRLGQTQVLSLAVSALPLKGVMLSYTDSAAAREVKGSVARRGLCGDAFLVATPAAARIGDVKVDTSVRKGELAFDVALRDLPVEGSHALRAQISEAGKPVAEFTSQPFSRANLSDLGRFSFTAQWKAPKLWDLHTPGNLYDVQVLLVDTAGKPLDIAFPVRFGYREFWIDGRDFYLNGSRIHLSAVPFDNAAVGAAQASYDGAKESLRRLKEIGINYVYTHNYGCEPGSHLQFEEILRAADDVGMLVGLSQPHFSHYDWKMPDADAKNGYAQHAEYYVRLAQDHPSVVMYPMSHNSTGYEEDMNPDMIDGKRDPRDTWSSNNVKLALRAEAIVKRFDPQRIVYHHASGNLGVMHDINYYANFVPIQEQSDWFGHWAAEGVKPVFTCEYGVPFTWDWTMYRGWYKGQREFGSAKVPWEFCLAEWNAQFLGDAAFKISDAEKTNLRWEAKQFRAGNTWHRWDYPVEVGSTRLEERYPVFAMYLTDNWRAFRTWGVSAISPWEHGHFWKLRDGVDRKRKDLPVDWEHLQRPGFSADYLDQRYERMDIAYEPGDWVATDASKALVRNNRPLLAYVAGKSAAFTGKDHLFHAGETFEKQLVVINESRREVTCHCEWSLESVLGIGGKQDVRVPTGDQARVPLRIELPAATKPGTYELKAKFAFEGGEEQTDSFAIHVLPEDPAVTLTGKIALFDPVGQTTELLKGLGVACSPVGADADLTGIDMLILGKASLGLDTPAPNLSRVRDGLKVIVFEQTPQVLEKRLGFRTEEYGLRNLFPRIAAHPILDGLTADALRDWRGESTTLPPRLQYEVRPRYGPTVQWCGIPIPRLWRCGNRGDVASALIEKPACGDFTPIVDGGYSLQYSPLLEYREGKGMVLFCQLDVTARTEADPAARRIVGNLLRYASAWKPRQARTALYAGEAGGMDHLKSIGVAAEPYHGGKMGRDQVLIVGPGAGKDLSGADVSTCLQDGGRLLAVGLDETEAKSLLPATSLWMKKAEHIAAYFEPFSLESAMAGIGPADVHNRDPREFSLLAGGATIVGDGVLATSEDGRVVCCQMSPWRFGPTPVNVKRTWRRSSFLLSRLLGNLGVAPATPLLARFAKPLDPKGESRWLDGLYVDRPEEWDEPYRHFRW